MDWAGQVDYQLDFPEQLYLDYSVSAKVSGDQVESLEDFILDFQYRADFLLESPVDFRTWGNISVEIQAMGKHKIIDLDFQHADDSDGMRLLLDDHGFAEEEFGTALPSAYQLSQDSLDQLGSSYQKLIEAMAVQYGPQLAEAWENIDGLGDLFHPVSITRFLLEAQTMDVFGWEINGDSVRLKVRMNEKSKRIMETQMQGMEGLNLSFYPSLFTDMEFEMTADLATGAMQTFHQTIDMPMTILVAEAPNGSITIDLKLTASMQRVELSSSAPAVSLPNDENVTHLDGPFLDLLPAMEVVLEMQAKQLHNAAAERDSQEDFSF